MVIFFEATFLHITEKLITDISRKLQLNKSNGPDNFGNIIFIFCSATLSKSLVLLFQTMTNKGKFPSIWKISQITPIYKEGSKAEVNCYRPISLLCCVSKIFEKVIFDEISNRRTTLFRRFDISSDDISILYLDFAKAFDKVPHHLLIKKLESFDVGGNMLLLLHSYLEDRKQFVKIGNCYSSLENVTSGVPQGSILGPLLFLIFINDLPDANPDIEGFGFTDDYKFIVHDQAKLDRSAKNIEDWCRENGMELNANNCKLLNVRGNLTTSMCGQEVKPTESQKDHGLIITSNLSWQGNCDHRVKKASSAFFQIERNMSPISSTSTKMNCYSGYIVPILTYCSQAWLPNRTNMYKIEKVQIMATKWILGNSLQSYKERLISLKLLPLCHYVELHDLLLFLAITRNEFDIPTNFKTLKDEWTRQHCRGELKIENNRLVKSDENFFHRTKQLYNVVNRNIQNLEAN